MFIVDSHCHLNNLNYHKYHLNLDDVITKALSYNVKFILAIATNLADYRNLKQLVGDRKNIALSCGIHPLNQQIPYHINELRTLVLEESVVALGETGLDYFYSQENKFQQQALFRQHIRIAISLNKPIIVHMRNACDDTIAILRQEAAERCKGVLHCFTENKETAKILLNLGFYISFSGIITFRNTENIRDVARYVPIDRILLETDSPYLAPVPHRGKENQPAFTRYIAEYVAILKKVDIETLAAITTENFCKLFHIPTEYLID
ncbi:YchF/TatD family DNA exonuclease [Pantoea sp. Mhis]|uniref:YchF/TatD family DNA exonuclease n=1 Tax=Pantoea sp. Mhis TaxID=2576759 RepID=UPI00135C7286|nr:YchF/TatD family DNA exonuclease [Pantoea sp. Mhis]MXP56313.1 YchF/TatD family DNA exonuclease [Pantoea sp. Mhis]